MNMERVVIIFYTCYTLWSYLIREKTIGVVMNISLRQFYVGQAMNGLLSVEMFANHKTETIYQKSCDIADRLIAFEVKTCPPEEVVEDKNPWGTGPKGALLVEHSDLSERFYLWQDQFDCWYQVPVSKQEYIEQWCELGDEEAETYALNCGLDFKGMRIDGPHGLTFTDPKKGS
jgi:hypothetical protein